MCKMNMFECYNVTHCLINVYTTYMIAHILHAVSQVDVPSQRTIANGIRRLTINLAPCHPHCVTFALCSVTFIIIFSERQRDGTGSSWGRDILTEVLCKLVLEHCC